MRHAGDDKYFGDTNEATSFDICPDHECRPRSTYCTRLIHMLPQAKVTVNFERRRPPLEATQQTAN